jgi:xanthine/uracil permease
VDHTLNRNADTLQFTAVFAAMPPSVLGGMTTFRACYILEISSPLTRQTKSVFGSVAVAGIRVLAYIEWDRRSRFIVTAALSLGFGAVLVPSWFVSISSLVT